MKKYTSLLVAALFSLFTACSFSVFEGNSAHPDRVMYYSFGVPAPYENVISCDFEPVAGDFGTQLCVATDSRQMYYDSTQCWIKSPEQLLYDYLLGAFPTHSRSGELRVLVRAQIFNCHYDRVTRRAVLGVRWRLYNPLQKQDGELMILGSRSQIYYSDAQPEGKKIVVNPGLAMSQCVRAFTAELCGQLKELQAVR